MRLTIYVLSSLVVFTAIALVYPGAGASDMASLIINLIGTLYAILSGFFTSILWSQYKDIQDSVAKETSNLVHAFYMSKLIPQPGFSDGLRERIDEYLITCMNMEWNEVTGTDHAFYKMLDSLKVIKNTDSHVFEEVMSSMGNIAEARMTQLVIGMAGLGTSRRLLLYLLSGILIFAIIYSKTTAIESLLISIVVSTAVVLVLFIINDLDSLRWNDVTTNIEPYETVFDAIGKSRYYLKDDIASGRVHLPTKSKYRVGEKYGQSA